jgi:hypothetical protein
MAEGRIDIEGWQVAEVVAAGGLGVYDHLAGGRLTLFRSRAGGWTLLTHQSRVKHDETGQPVEGEAWLRAKSYAGLDELKAELVKWGQEEDWRELVKSGAGEPYYDLDLMRLWAPVQIDLDLNQSSVYRRELALRGGGRAREGWRGEALGLAVDRLEQIGFVVLKSEVDHRKVFPRGLGEWSNPVVGAVVAARLGHRVQLVVAIDGAGEIYTRSADANFTPGEPRRHPPKPLTDRELDQVEELRRRRREERGPEGRS